MVEMVVVVEEIKVVEVVEMVEMWWCRLPNGTFGYRF